MKREMKKVMIALGLVLISLGAVSGCRKSISGKYVNRDNPGEYFEFKKDGTFLWVMPAPGEEEPYKTPGQWKIIEKNKIRFYGPKILTTFYGKMKRNTIQIFTGAGDYYIKQD